MESGLGGRTILRRPIRLVSVYRPRLVFAFLCSWLILTASCTIAVGTDETVIPQPTPLTLTVTADGEARQITTSAATVADALVGAGIDLGPFDEVEPPRGASLIEAGTGEVPAITIVRVTETLEVVPESVPYGRRIVRSAEMTPDDPPRILQTGVAGLKEISYRIVFRDGLEAERWPTAVAIIEAPVDEIVMIGIGEEEVAMPIAGRLAYIDNGRAILLEGSTDSARQLSIEGQLDGRVFQLSPGGNFLLYTIRSAEETNRTEFRNQIWVIPTAEGGRPRALQIENVLWAGWDPAGLNPLRIAYTTARSVSLPPGWEANNDLWLMEIALDDNQPAPVRLIGTTAAAFGWWGGEYAWSPTGDRLAYAFADEVGVLAIPDVTFDDAAGFVSPTEPERSVLYSFPTYDTGADWAWVPALSWSPDGRFLAFTVNAGGEDRFNLVVADTSTGDVITPFVNVGIWSAAIWSPATDSDGERLALLRAAEPVDGEDGDYILWLAGSDGTNARRIFPPEGERGRFARSRQSLAWGPDPDVISFIFDDELHILNLATGEIHRPAPDDTAASHPAWAPYGAAAGQGPSE